MTARNDEGSPAVPRGATLTASLSPDEWTSVFGQRRVEVPNEFNAAIPSCVHRLESAMTKDSSDVMTEVLESPHFQISHPRVISKSMRNLFLGLAG